MGSNKLTIVAEGNVSTTKIYLDSNGKLHKLSSDGGVIPGPITSDTGKHHKTPYPKNYFRELSEDDSVIPRLWSSFLVDFPKEEFSRLFVDVEQKAKKEKSLDFIASSEDKLNNSFFLGSDFNVYSLADDLVSPVPIWDLDVAKNVSFYKQVYPSTEMYKSFLSGFFGNNSDKFYLEFGLIPFFEMAKPLSSKGATSSKVRNKLISHVDLASGQNFLPAKDVKLEGMLFRLLPNGYAPFVQIDEPDSFTRENILSSSINPRLCYVPLTDKKKDLKRFSNIMGLNIFEAQEIYEKLAFHLTRKTGGYQKILIPQTIGKEYNSNFKKNHFITKKF